MFFEQLIVIAISRNIFTKFPHFTKILSRNFCMCQKHFREISHRFCIMSLDLFSRKNSLRNANENFSIFRETFCSLQTLIKSIGETHKKKHFSSLKNDVIFHILIRLRFLRYLCKSDITIFAWRVT